MRLPMDGGFRSSHLLVHNKLARCWKPADARELRREPQVRGSIRRHQRNGRMIDRLQPIFATKSTRSGHFFQVSF